MDEKGRTKWTITYLNICGARTVRIRMQTTLKLLEDIKTV